MTKQTRLSHMPVRDPPEHLLRVKSPENEVFLEGPLGAGDSLPTGKLAREPENDDNESDGWRPQDAGAPDYRDGVPGKAGFVVSLKEERSRFR